MRFDKEDVEIWLKEAEDFIGKVEELTLSIIEDVKLDKDEDV